MKYLNVYNKSNSKGMSHEETNLSLDSLQFLADNSVIGIYIVDEQTGRCKYWNRRCVSIFKYTANEMIGKLVNDVVKKKEVPVDDSCVLMVDKNGFEFMVDLDTKVYNGNVYYYVGVPAKDRLPLQHIMEIANIAVYAKTSDGTYKHMNSSTERLFENTREKMLGKTDYDFFDKTCAATLRKRDKEAIEANKSIITDDVYKFLHKPETYIFSTLRYFKDETLYCLTSDVTPIRDAMNKLVEFEKAKVTQKEQLALQSSRMKSEFLANMSHEIRTPINGIVGLNNLLKDTVLTEEQSDYVDGIHRSCGALMSIINDILDISKIEAGKIDLEYLDVSVKELLDDLHGLFQITANTKGLFFETHNTIEDDHVNIKADYGRVRQILNNLLSNAFKFTTTGGIVLNAMYKSVNDTLRFEVVDTGIGIPTKTVESLFQPFTQAEASTTRRFGGTGLGLSISKSLVALMNGYIGLSSVEGSGSTFWFEIPYIKGQEREKVPLLTDVKPVSKRSLHILVVEDNMMNQKVALKTIEKLGHRVTLSDNGREAIHMLKQFPDKFDVVLMDCFMPILDGYEATKEIRQLDPPLKNIPIIAMTANALKGEEKHCLDVGMNDFMTKPINKIIIQDKLLYWTNEK